MKPLLLHPCKDTRVRGLVVWLALSLSFCVVATASAENITSASAVKSLEGEPTAPSAQASDEINTATLDKALIADLIVRYTNEERRKAGLQELTTHTALQEVAEKHSIDMATRGYFSHTSERKESADIPFGDRVSMEKLGLKRIAENIALQPIVLGQQTTTHTLSTGETKVDVNRTFATYEGLSRQTVDGWMKSPGHRKNILTPEFNLIGIGIASGEREGTPYAWITQNFGHK